VFHTSERCKRPGNFADALVEGFAGPKHGGIELHRLLHFEADFSRRPRSVGLAQLLQPGDCKIGCIPGERLVARARFDDFGAPARRFPAKHDEVQQRI
jgi:hypothetical protein